MPELLKQFLVIPPTVEVMGEPVDPFMQWCETEPKYINPDTDLVWIPSDDSHSFGATLIDVVVTMKPTSIYPAGHTILFPAGSEIQIHEDSPFVLLTLENTMQPKVYSVLNDPASVGDVEPAPAIEPVGDIGPAPAIEPVGDIGPAAAPESFPAQ